MRGTRVILNVCLWRTPSIANGATAMNSPRGRDQIREFLTRKWEREMEYRLIKELWAYDSHHRRAIRLRMARSRRQLVPFLR